MIAGTRRIPAGVWMLGFVSLLMDTSSELIHALLPLYMVGALGASVLVVGLIEGAAEAIALIVKVFSGYWSDMFGRRKPAVLLGYGLAAVSKLAFPLAPSLGFVVAGSIVTEQVFSYPGIGKLMIQSVQGLDYALMQGVFLVITLTVLAANFAMDLFYGLIDPRVRSHG